MGPISKAPYGHSRSSEILLSKWVCLRSPISSASARPGFLCHMNTQSSLPVVKNIVCPQSLTPIKGVCSGNFVFLLCFCFCFPLSLILTGSQNLFLLTGLKFQLNPLGAEHSIAKVLNHLNSILTWGKINHNCPSSLTQLARCS